MGTLLTSSDTPISLQDSGVFDHGDFVDPDEKEEVDGYTEKLVRYHLLMLSYPHRGCARK